MSEAIGVPPPPFFLPARGSVLLLLAVARNVSLWSFGKIVVLTISAKATNLLLRTGEMNGLPVASVDRFYRLSHRTKTRPEIARILDKLAERQLGMRNRHPPRLSGLPDRPGTKDARLHDARC